MPIRLADGSLWIDPPTYADGSGCSQLGNRNHTDAPPNDSPAARELFRRYRREDLLELYGHIN